MPGISAYLRRKSGGITFEEWKKMVSEDCSLDHIQERSFVDTQGNIKRKPYTDRSAEWNGHPEKVPYMFRWHDGEVVVDRPDDAAMNKLREIGDRLGAHQIDFW